MGLLKAKVEELETDVHVSDSQLCLSDHVTDHVTDCRMRMRKIKPYYFSNQ